VGYTRGLELEAVPRLAAAAEFAERDAAWAGKRPARRHRGDRPPDRARPLVQVKQRAGGL
jgi:hypothetical protein